MENASKDVRSKLALLKIPSGEDILVGRMHIAEGAGPHPTIIMLHGFPGVIMNLDIASELHQKSWNVLVINYRGAWGSQGTFSYTNALEDVQATIQYIKQNKVADENRIDIDRIGLLGHSFGGFLALKTASTDPSIKAVASLSPANLGLFVHMIEQNPAIESQIYEGIKESSFFLHGCTAESIMEEVRNNRNDWNTFLFASTLVDRKLLLTAATHDDELPKAFFHDPLVQILENDKEFQHKVFETDHGYTNVRKELALTLDEWFRQNL
ncbi:MULTISPECIES: alpha/beta hydrolase [unclassified Bacillus (in: firmicutes)]|uniref:alpha/beta hydrolase n=1 Tax=unclassified Bacillus (in: firmicutes) TaxID=185979 RepID=UPI0008EC0CDB|nr:MULTISPECIES: alpha/beta fold hydrolase [unclassified Bacillus (in: firmicutes)]SFB20074.1 Alpha/beta hydrolase family protein [Bacillus sp. UNCCL13]SFQ90812.1 Alpha/beta hydrolase family protein [Bacillus sp. cl95]